MFAMCLAGKEIFDQHNSIDFQICRDITKNCTEGSHLEGFMIWDGDVMLDTFDSGCQSNVAPGLASDFVTVRSK